MQKLIFSTLLLILPLALPAQAQGDDENYPINDRFRIYLGVFYPTVDSTITINGSMVNPPPISVEDILGVEDSEAVAWGGARWRISRRNQLEFEFFKLNRSGVQGFSGENIEVGDFIVESGAIDTTFNFALGRLTYGFSLVRNERMDVQIKGGLHIADFSATLQLIGNVCDTAMGEMPPCPMVSSPTALTESVTAPLPHLGGSFAYAFTKTLGMRLQAIGFALELDSIDGALLEIDADLGWQPWRHFGFGVGLRFFDINVKSKGSDLNGEFDYQYFGPVLYLNTTF